MSASCRHNLILSSIVHSSDSPSSISSSSPVTTDALRDADSESLPDFFLVIASFFMRGDAWKMDPLGSNAAENADVLAFGVECKGEFDPAGAKSEFTNDCGPYENEELKE